MRMPPVDMKPHITPQGVIILYREEWQESRAYALIKETLRALGPRANIRSPLRQAPICDEAPYGLFMVWWRR